MKIGDVYVSDIRAVKITRISTINKAFISVNVVVLAICSTSMQPSFIFKKGSIMRLNYNYLLDNYTFFDSYEHPDTLKSISFDRCEPSESYDDAFDILKSMLGG